jgi:hypothetical protein
VHKSTFSHIHSRLWGVYDQGMIFDDLLPIAEYWLYRTGSYLLTHVMDDPAWLALIFC